ncbi:hypothetical protein BC829DRAFT_390695 [Chytridium lagenaria]|nr:hypothetical protein BC829DRAFT_390695 [Chytridium lagenaria]
MPSSHKSKHDDKHDKYSKHDNDDYMPSKHKDSSDKGRDRSHSLSRGKDDHDKPSSKDRDSRDRHTSVDRHASTSSHRDRSHSRERRGHDDDNGGRHYLTKPSYGTTADRPKTSHSREGTSSRHEEKPELRRSSSAGGPSPSPRKSSTTDSRSPSSYDNPPVLELRPHSNISVISFFYNTETNRTFFYTIAKPIDNRMAKQISLDRHRYSDF